MDCKKWKSTPCENWNINEKSEKEFLGEQIQKPTSSKKKK